MPKFGAHAFLWIDEWTLEKGNHAIREASRLGFDFIEIPLLKPDQFDARSHKKTLEDVGLGATASLVLPPGAHMPDAPDRARDFLIAALDKLWELGGNYLCGCIGYQLGRLTGSPPTAKERDTIVDTLREVAVEAQKRGMTIALEVVNRYETYLYNTLSDGREAVRAIGLPNVQLHADTYHMNIEEEGFYSPLVGTSDVLGYIHMSESHRGLVGSGTVNWDQVFSGLKDADYKGPLVLESFAAVNPDLAAATCLWRPPKLPPGVLAELGLQFLKEKSAQFELA